jgi:hypothetical protein
LTVIKKTMPMRIEVLTRNDASRTGSRRSSRLSVFCRRAILGPVVAAPMAPVAIRPRSEDCANHHLDTSSSKASAHTLIK